MQPSLKAFNRDMKLSPSCWCTDVNEPDIKYLPPLLPDPSWASRSLLRLQRQCWTLLSLPLRLDFTFFQSTFECGAQPSTRGPTDLWVVANSWWQILLSAPNALPTHPDVFEEARCSSYHASMVIFTDHAPLFVYDLYSDSFLLCPLGVSDP